jgi:hypothetical protein
MLSNLTTLVLDQATDRSVFTDRTSPLNPSCMLQRLLISFMLPLILNLQIILIRCCIGLMMYSIYINESVIHVSIIARPSHLCLPLSEKLNSLLDHLDNKMIIVMVETRPIVLRLPRQEGVCRGHMLESLVMILHCYTTNSSAKNCGTVM